MMGCLYRITMPSGKSYIGITSYTAEDRFAEHAYNAKRGLQRGINRAIRKYGAESAKLETLVICDKWDYLVDLERRAIAAFGTKGAGGYNMTDGGEGPQGYKHTPESLRKMGDTHRGNSYRVGMKHTDEAKAKMSAARLGKPRLLSDKVRSQLVQSMTGNKHSLGRVVPTDELAMRSASAAGISHGGRSGVVGVYPYKSKWRACITKDRKQIHLGYFDTIELASDAYSRSLLELFGGRA